MSNPLDFQTIDQLLTDSFQNLKLDNQEKRAMLSFLAELPADRRRYMRNRAFDFVREQVVEGAQADALAALR